MMRYFFLLAIFISACSSNTTAPVTQPAHPFPKAFKQVAVSFRNLPEHWNNSSSSYSEGQPNTSTTDTGTSPLSGNWNFYFNDKAFAMYGDTLKAGGIDFLAIGESSSLNLVADQTSGLLNYLSLSYYYDTSIDVTPWGKSTSYGFTCHNISYTADSSNQIVVRLSGQAVQTALAALSYQYLEGEDYSSHGYSNSNTTTYIGSVTDSSTLTVRFIP